MNPLYHTLAMQIVEEIESGTHTAGDKNAGHSHCQYKQAGCAHLSRCSLSASLNQTVGG